MITRPPCGGALILKSGTIRPSAGSTAKEEFQIYDFFFLIRLKSLTSMPLKSLLMAKSGGSECVSLYLAIKV